MNKLILDAKEVLGELRSKVTQSGGEPDEAEGIALMLASKVLMGDGKLELEESEFLDALLPESCTGATFAHAENYAARWDGMAGCTPTFLRTATSYDRGHDTHFADDIVDHIEAIAFRAAAVALPALVECELGPIRDYCGFLRKCVADLRR
ncbi:MAG: hypothetical protein MUF81_08235 [Verrucomicrobia bacterium]|nr:hypothetical protein [Verrucomicrobiota bacterium]